MTLPAKALFNLLGPRTLSRFDSLCEHPMRVQEGLLRALLRDNVRTEFGRRHGFASIEAFSGFQMRLPLIEYQTLEPYIEAARHGQEHQLTREQPVFYAVTSGTTGASKYIPVTPSSRGAKGRVMRVWLSALFRDHPSILNGQILQVTSPEVEEYAPDGTPCGAEAGHAYRNMPRAMRGMYPVPYEVFEIADYQDRYYTLLRFAVGCSLSAIGTPNPSTIMLLARQMREHTERLLKDVRDGTLNEEILRRTGGADPWYHRPNVCALGAGAALRYWPDVSLPDGPFVQVNPRRLGACADAPAQPRAARTGCA